MVTTPSHLVVFLGSPSDVPDERRETSTVVDRLNRSIAREIGWYVELLGWEDTLPGYGRPQALINKDVDACDLFIGLLYKRWGTPTDDYTSGFEEEFERAIARRRETGSPEIWLCFKKVPDEFLGDPGEQLERVLDFREKQRARGEVLFTEFTESADWYKYLFEKLPTYLIRTSNERNAHISSPNESISTRGSTSPADEGKPEERTTDVARNQVIKLFANASEYLNSDTKRLKESLDDFDLARLSLTAASWFASTEIEEELSAHVVNRLYKARSRLKATAPEAKLLFSNIVASKGENTPGWYWWRKVHASGQERLLALLPRVLRNDYMRVAAIDLMAEAELPLHEEFRTPIVQLALDGKNALIRTSVLRYVAATGSAGDLALIEQVLEKDQSLEFMAELAKLSLLARVDPVACLNVVIEESPYVTEEVLTPLRAARFVLDRALGERALQASKPEIREFAIQKLQGSGQLRKPDALRLLSDEIFFVRRAAVRAILKKGWQVPVRDLVAAAEPPESASRRFEDKRELLAEIYAGRPSQELLEIVDWFVPDTHGAYAAWVMKNSAEAATTARADLDSRFSRLKTLGIEKLRDRHGAEAVPVVIEQWSSFEGMLSDELAGGVLRAIAEHGAPEDADLVRKSLDMAEHWSKDPAIDALLAVGTESDATILIPLASDYAVGEKAAAAALSLSPGPSGAAANLIDHEKPAIVRLAIRSLRGDASAEELVKPALRNSNSDIRKEAVAYLCTIRSNKDLEALMEAYAASAPYYYNVIHWLDRYLYSKGHLRSHFKRKLMDDD